MKELLARIPTELYEKIVKSAKDNERSIMKEIVFRLKKSFDND
jgi:hypothetical protein